MTNLPATLNEAEARAWAHKALTLFKEKPAEIFGEYIHPFDAAECRLLTVDLLKDFALIDTEHMMQLVSWAREGIGLAQDAAQQLINEFDNRGIETPTILKAYGMDLIRNQGRPVKRISGPKKADNVLRDRAIAFVVAMVAHKFNVKPRRNRASSRPCACSIVADALAMSEFAVVAIWQKSFWRRA